jgi:hypothetical protein
MDASFFQACRSMSRREALGVCGGAGAMMAALGCAGGAERAAGDSRASPPTPAPASDLARSPKRYPNRKSINL